MTVDVTLPQAGMGMTDGEVIDWHYEVGDFVPADAMLVEVEAAKATVDIVAPVGGVLTEIVAQSGDTVEVGGVLGRIAPGDPPA